MLNQKKSQEQIVWPTRQEWWLAIRWVLLVFTVIVALTLVGSFVSYQRVLAQGHPWLPNHRCSGCPFCGMTRSFCAMSSGHWREAFHWNRGGPPLYGFFWLWSATSGAGLIAAVRGTFDKLKGLF